MLKVRVYKRFLRHISVFRPEVDAGFTQPAAKAAASKLRESLPADAPAGAKSRLEGM